MRKISNDELKNFKTRGKGRASHVFDELINLQKDETAHIEPADWKRKSSPSKLCRYIEKNYPLKFECRALADKKGWLVKRIS